MVTHEISEAAQSPKSLLPFFYIGLGLDFELGLGHVGQVVQFSLRSYSGLEICQERQIWKKNDFYIPSFDMQMFKIFIIPSSLPVTLFKIIRVACTK